MNDVSAWPTKKASEWTDEERRRVRLLVYGGAPASLDGTRLAREISRDVPEANQAVRMVEWRADLKRRVKARLGRK